MKRRGVREVARIEPGQVAILEADHTMTLEEMAGLRREWQRVTGDINVMVLSGLRMSGVCNVRPWKRAR